ncbi:MFS transporter [Streptomyces albulus]|nr:MFS transporter [Streptomyces noursei]
MPAGTVLSQHAGWRTAFWAVAGLTVLSALSLLIALPAPRQAPTPARHPSLRGELAAMARPRLWLSYLITALTFGAGVVTFSYLAPLLTEVTGLPPAGSPRCSRSTASAA